MCNIGVVYQNLGEYDKSMSYFQKYYQASEDTGCKLDQMIALSNIAGAYKEKTDYTNSVEFYNRSIALARELKLDYHLCFFLYHQATLYYSLNHFTTAYEVNIEANNLGQLINRQDVVFSSTVFAYKLLALEQPGEAVAKFAHLLQSETETSNLAIIHYEIYKINQSAEHKQKALVFYQELYSKTPKNKKKNHIDELCISQ